MRDFTALIIIVVALMLAALSNPHAGAQTTRPAPAATAAPATPHAAKPDPAAKADLVGKTFAAPTETDATRALTARVPETKLENVRLEDAITFLQDASGANIHVNWRALETVNITRETPVTLRVRPLSLRKLLQYTLMEADGSGLTTFYAEDGVIEVTTRELADQRLITKVYPVDDLLLQVPDFDDAPQFQLGQSAQTGRGGGGGGQSLISSTTGDGGNDAAGSSATRGQGLVQLIMETVQPEVWRENGGTASIRYFRGRLIVTAPRSVHEKIGGVVP